jgi:hypothetical protein
MGVEDEVSALGSCSASTASSRRMTASRSGKMSTTSVRRRTSRLNVRGGVAPDLSPHLRGEGGEGQYVGAGGLEVFGQAGQLVSQGILNRSG